jgi:hypothetical protein
MQKWYTGRNTSGRKTSGRKTSGHKTSGRVYVRKQRQKRGAKKQFFFWGGLKWTKNWK